MATSADIERRLGAHASRRAGPAREGPRAALGPTLALTVTLAVAAFLVALAIVELLVHPRPLPPPLNLGQKQTAETALYLLAFGGVVPLALLLVPRLAGAIAASPNGPALSSLTALLTAALAGAILAVRVIRGGGVGEVLAALAAWWIASVVLLSRARSPRPWPALLALARFTVPAWLLAGVLLLTSLLAFTSLKSISPVALVLGAAAGALVVGVRARASSTLPSVGRRAGAAIDAAALALILLAVPDLVIFAPAGAGSGFLGAFERSVVQFHHDFVLGPTNVVLHGGTMLVDTASQYGIGSIYFLAGWFHLAPIGYGTLGLLDGVLFALFFSAGYCLLRLGGTSRLLSVSALTIAVVVLIYNLLYSVGSLPAQHGPLRFGLPMALILAAVAEARWPHRARSGTAAQLVVLGIASVWALEAFAYTLVTFAAIACFGAWMEPHAGRFRRLGRRAVLGVVACLAAHLLLVGVTLVRAGRLPDYGLYLAFLRSFAFGKVGSITYDFSRWSAGVAVGVAYAALAMALILVAHRRRDLAEGEKPAMTALCGLTAYGVILFSYFDDRSADHILPYVCLPALLAGTLWLSLLLRGALGAQRPARLGGLAFALGLCVLLSSVAWSSIGERFSRSALGHLAPGGASVSVALHRLWHEPPLDPRAAEGVQLVARYMPASDRVLTLVAPDLETEILLRANRTNALGLAYPTEDSFVSARFLPELRRALARMHPGDRLLTQTDGLRALIKLRDQPSRDTLADPIATSLLAPLQQWVLQRIGERYDLAVLHRDTEGFVVAALTPRR